MLIFDPICSLRGNEKGKLRQIKGGSMGDVQLKKRGYIWAISAGFNAALAAISAKFFSSLVLKYGLVVLCNVWFAGALSITIGVVILSKSSVDKKAGFAYKELRAGD
ncbi:hypothetical protein Bca52824_064583 [Brassica carinata]|uniref:Uncharacterized protein n=1 Tax=Brassica carinata TaxID=52824 RepID=A0A8X7QI45_BRACI|nr:hypothetical protein Bca52824_064583 [Brassica carinata]